MHTDVTLNLLDKVTTALGKELRVFSAETCTAFNTRELKREVAARNRKRKSKKQDKSHSHAATSDSCHSVSRKQEPDTPRTKLLNLNTYKVHALGDYVSTIRRFGTTDSYTTETVCFSLYPVGGFVCLRFLVGRENLSTAHPKLDTFARVGRISPNR